MKTYIVRDKQGNFIRNFYSEVEDPTYWFGQPDQVDVECRDSNYAELLEICHMRRAPAYPPLSVLGDAIFHAQNGNNQPMTDYLALCQAVKNKYPKPVAP